MSGTTWISSAALWAQTTTAATPTTATSDAPTSVLMLAVRRWSSSLTLSPFDPSPTWGGLWAWLVGLGVALIVAGVFQGPVRMLLQFLDLPGHLRLLSRSLKGLRSSSRLLGIVFGVTVLTWSTNQAITYEGPQGRTDLTTLLRGRSLSFLALEHGWLAALTPLRDILLLGNMIPLLVAGTVALFQFTSEKYSSVQRVLSPRAGRDSMWGTIAWGALALHATYRFLCLIYLSGELPLGGCLVVEAGVVPVLMALSDGVVLAWVLAEIRNAGLGDAASENVDFGGMIALLPATILACVLAMPARYLATAVALVLPYIPTPSATSTGQVIPVPSNWQGVLLYVRWQLGPGLVMLQAASLAFVGLIGASAWSRGSIRSTLRGFRHLLGSQGGRLVGLLAMTGLLTVGLSAAVYFVVLAIPTQPWVLRAADAYAHYASLPVGLILTSALVELGRLALPRARAVEEEKGIVADSAANVDEPLRVG